MSTSFARLSLSTTAVLAGIAAVALGAAPGAEAATGSTSSASSSATASTSASPAYRGSSDAVFVQNDAVSGNQVEVYQRAADGTLSLVKGYATGGLGGQLTGSVVDHLASEGSLTYDAAHHLLYAVNAGSNTVSVFAVDGVNLTLRQTVSSGGTFPVSVAVHGSTVYVLNAENGGSVQGYRVEGGRLQLQSDWNRQLGLESDGTPQFTHTPGQVGFAANGSELLVTTKAAGNDVYAYHLTSYGAPSRSVTVNSLPGTVPFAFVSTGWNQIALVQAGTNAVVSYDVSSEGTLTQLSSYATGQAATCWIADADGTLFASNAGSGDVTGLDLGANGSLTALGNTSTDAGTVDAAASPDGHYLYVQTGGNGIVDEYHVAANGSLTKIGSQTVPNAVGAEGITVG
jgi:6-phosphogluconolactonase (cycloisomerase 2 family)